MLTAQTLSRLSLPLILAVGCGEVDPKVRSPKHGEELRGDRAPIVVQVPLSWSGSGFSMRLDGEPYEDPLAELRRRKNSSSEKGAQLVADLPLEGLEPGKHRLEVTFERELWPDRTLVSVFHTKPREHHLSLRVHDGEGRPVNARVSLQRPGGPLRMLDKGAWNTDPKRRDLELDALLLRDGEGSVRLDSGRYRLVASRGLRDAVAVVDLVMVGDRELELALPRVVETPGVVAADLHVHTGSSYDGYTPHAWRADSLACSGLDAVALADHNRIARPERFEAALAGEADTPWLIPGIEADMRGRQGKQWDWGHLTAWPVAAGSPPPSRWPGSPANAVVDWRRHQAEHPHPVTGSELLLTLAHPRGIQFRADERSKRHAWALFNNVGFDREVPVGEGSNAWMLETSDADEHTVMDFDAIEVVNRMGLIPYREVRLDWFALLNQGHGLTGMGNSDSHALAVELVGMPQNLIHGGLGAAGELDLPGLLEASRAGRVSVTTGPILDLELLGPAGERAGLGETLRVADGRVRARVRVRAAPWVPVHELRLVQDGRVVHRVDLGGLARDDGPAFEHVELVELELAADAWLLAEAGWPLEKEQAPVGGTYGQVYPGYVPFSFTNPVRVDADADGRWDPPGLQPEGGHGL